MLGQRWTNTRKQNSQTEERSHARNNKVGATNGTIGDEFHASSFKSAVDDDDDDDNEPK